MNILVDSVLKKKIQIVNIEEAFIICGFLKKFLLLWLLLI